MCQIRNSAKAIIIKNNKLLCTKNKDQFGIFYLLPGGGQKHFETIKDALKRECKEEISTDIIVKDILFVRDYIGKNHEFAKWDSKVHQIEYMFECDLKEDIKIKNGNTPDNMQIGISWLNLDELKNYRIYPKFINQLLKNNELNKNKIYLGDIN
jgi:8-oxo-dGTP pyrophosphatase MutT (NUDIX family)